MVALALVLLAAAPSAAQDRARLDDFAIPAGEQAVGIDQLPSAEPLPPEQARDRSLMVAQPPIAQPGPIDQLSSADEDPAQSQLTDSDASRRLAPASISSAADSKPHGAPPIEGHDRCDPRLDSAQRAECLRILELRADEFHATEAPQLSPEQRLLARQQVREGEGLASTGRRLRLATSEDPDADLLTNQEIASIYLERVGGVAAPPPSEPETQPGIPTGDLIEALQAALPGAVQR